MSEDKKSIKLYKLDTKFVQGLKKYGGHIKMPATTMHFFPVVVIKPSGSPVGMFQLVDFKDMPDEILVNFGLQKNHGK